MSCEEKVLSILKKLEKDDSGANTKDLLIALGKLDISLKVLTSTKIGMKVNTLRKTEKDEEVIALTRSLIKSWKKLVPDKDGKKEKEKESKFSVLHKEKSKSKEHSKEPKEERRIDHDERKRVSLDDVRQSCSTMIHNAIKGDGEMPEGFTLNQEAIANEIEEEIFDKFNTNNVAGPKYKAQIRSRVFNLKDKLNPKLRINLIMGGFSAKEFAHFTSEQMSSAEMKEQRIKDEKTAMDKAQLAHVEGTTTDLLKCGKCNKRNCTYNQLQTRSADEPMTTFVLCNECGNRWKFC